MDTPPPKQLAGPCKHCRTPVIRDNRGNWVHSSLKYTCIDRWGGILPTYAEPAPARGVASVGPPRPAPRPARLSKR